MNLLAPEELPAAAKALLDQGFRVALVSGHDDGDHLRAVYVFLAPAPDRRTELHVQLPKSAPRVPSLARLSFPAGRFEREMRDLFGIVPENHPQPRRLVRHFHWPRGWYPMRAGAGAPPEFGAVDGPYPFRAVEGDGVYEIPVGPVHAGMIEPGHFRFSVVGETILNLKARLWFVHKGLETLFPGRAPGDGIELAERISGDTAVGHALAYCLAVEDALGWEMSAGAARVRVILLELERIHNHVADLGALCNDVGHSVLNAHAQTVREKLLRHNEEVTGHRLLRGAVQLGGARLRRMPDVARVRSLAAEAEEIASLALEHSVVRDRFAGTAVLSAQQAADLGTLGYVARASGLGRDARYDHPFLDLGKPVQHSRTDGDVLSRFVVRVEEIGHSAALVEQLVAKPDVTPPPVAEGPRSGIGVVEGWRGTIVHRVELSGGVLSRVKVVDPSFFNWPALPVALVDTIVPDFPLTNKSFNLSYAGNDL
ncbi:NADH-quinone oxidoreductase subunit C [Amycolatopsis jejuensis]|uniref:hydrogenase large subunit n=1 Tax=Amycolatopsis jejuensis TaxID=330084 RepID=UPI0005268946|nr:NADH-quinone oxidoreductase subunit C [Amycolatopsis jejuensis]